MNVWSRYYSLLNRYSYLWTVVLGWIAFFLFVSINVQAGFWIGNAAGFALALAGIAASAIRLGRTKEDTIVHGVTWMLAVTLAFLSGIWIYLDVTAA